MKLNSSTNYLAIALFGVISFVVDARLGLTGTPEFKERILQDDNDNVQFCWKDTVTRGVGLIPDGCPDGKELIGLLCYSSCPSGYARFGFDCHQICPSDFSDDGLFCRKDEYGRGVGYPWEFGDPLDDSAMFDRCESDHGSGNCETWGAVVYPKCAAGYSPFGCCLCRPAVPDCGALGMNDGVDLDCAKKITIGDPTPMTCRSGLHESGGLCYENPCPSGTDAVGPVCWDNTPPSGFVGCGMGYAKSDLVCAERTLNQVVAVFESAASIATLGITAAAKNARTTTDRLVELADRIKYAEDQVEGFRDFVDGANFGAGLHSLIDGGLPPEDVKPADAVRMGSDIVGLLALLGSLDPTGLSGVVSAFSYEKCSTHFGS